VSDAGTAAPRAGDGTRNRGQHDPSAMLRAFEVRAEARLVERVAAARRSNSSLFQREVWVWRTCAGRRV